MSNEPYEPDPESSLRCLHCQRLVDFSRVEYMTGRSIVLKCDCGKYLRCKADNPIYEECRYRLLTGWESVAVPYSAADLPPFYVPSVDHKYQRFTIAMVAVNDAETFLAKCLMASLPMSADPDNG